MAGKDYEVKPTPASHPHLFPHFRDGYSDDSIPVDYHNWVKVRTLTDEEQGNYVVWDAQYECTKCGSIDFDVPPITAGCGPKLYYGLTPEEYLNVRGKERPD